MRFTFKAPLWESVGEKTTWVFVTLPTGVADELEEASRGHQSALGSVRVGVAIGASSWHTSVFPDAKAGSYILPIKKPIRVAESLKAGDRPSITLTFEDDAGD